MTRPTGASRSTAQRVVAAIAAIPLILATVVLARLIEITTPIPDDHRRPWIHQGQMNEPVLENDLEVTVRSVRGGRAYADGFRAPTTDGVFLLVRTRVMAIDSPAAAAYAELIDEDGNAYATLYQTDSLYLYELSPGVPIEGELLFEVPQTVATELRLRLSSTSGYWPQWQVMVEVPLQIDAADVDRWSRSTTTLTMMEPEIAG